MYHRYSICFRRILDIFWFAIHVYTCIYMYIHVYTCICMYIHVCTCRFTLLHPWNTFHNILQLQTDTNEVRTNRTEVLGPPPEPEFCALSFWNDRGSPLVPSDSVLFEKLMMFWKWELVFSPSRSDLVGLRYLYHRLKALVEIYRFKRVSGPIS